MVVLDGVCVAHDERALGHVKALLESAGAHEQLQFAPAESLQSLASRRLCHGTTSRHGSDGQLKLAQFRRAVEHIREREGEWHLLDKHEALVSLVVLALLEQPLHQLDQHGALVRHVGRPACAHREYKETV